MPLPPALRGLLSPGALDFQQRVSLATGQIESWRSLSLVSSAWLQGAALLATAVLGFWIARSVSQSRGVRRLARSIAWMGLAASGLAMVQPALFDNQIYGFWKPLGEITRPAGPIVSRNHFAAWLLLALPLTAGYLVAHIRTHWANRSRRVQLLADTRALWLAAASIFMTAALFVTQSRAGIIGFVVAVGIGFATGWRRMGLGGRAALLAYATVLVAATLLWANPEAVIVRFDQVNADAWGGRPEIWRETLDLIGRFWLTGVGLGAFDVVMAVYQTATHAVLLNHAHSQYLQVAAEGGVLIGLPLLVAAGAFGRLAARRLASDRSPLVHVRQGAVAGICGLAVQAIWETPLLTPAVVVLLATVAAIAVHTPARDRMDDRGVRLQADDAEALR